MERRNKSVVGEDTKGAENRTSVNLTSLDLFSYKGDSLVRVLERRSQVNKYVGAYESSESKTAELLSSIGDRIKRLDSYEGDIYDTVSRLYSSITCGFAWQTFAGYYEEKGGSDKAFKIFKFCLDVNTRVCQRVIELVNREKFSSKIDRFGKEVSIGTIFARRPEYFWDLVKKVNVHIPEWMRSDPDLVEEALGIFVNFSLLLNPNGEGVIAGFDRRLRSVSAIDLNSRFGPTMPDGYPDWLIDNSDNPPGLDTVKQEYMDDLNEVTRLTQEVIKIREQKEYLKVVQDERVNQSLLWLENRRRLLLTPDSSLSELLLYLGALNKVQIYKGDISRLSSIGQEDIRKELTKGAENITEVIKEFTNTTNVVKSRELVALWLEEQMKQAGFTNNEKYTEPDKAKDILSVMLDESKETDLRLYSQGFSGLKETNKKAYGALNYEVKPLLYLLNEQEIIILKEFLKDKNVDISSIILLFTDAIVDSFARGINPVNSHSEIAISHLSDFSKKWLNKNWQHALKLLEGSLQKNLSTQPLKMNDAEVKIVQPDMSYEDAILAVNPVELHPVESIQHENGRSTLCDYTIVYHEYGDRNNIFVLPNQSIEDMEDAFSKLIRHEGISMTTDPAIIIRTLETHMNYPKEDNQIKMKQIIHGEPYNKIRKKSGMRIFYQVDERNKEIVFTTYKKEDWKYQPA